MPLSIPVILSAYNPDWPALAISLADNLQMLGQTLVVVHHIGSTAVAGLMAKPIIDLMPLVNDLGDLDGKRGVVERLGYDWHGDYGISGRRYCTLSCKNGLRIAQLHFFQSDSPHATRHLAFRDYLREHPEAAKAYEREKCRAQSLHPNDSHAYNDEKSAWVRNLEAKALAWSAVAELNDCAGQSHHEK